MLADKQHLKQNRLRPTVELMGVGVVQLLSALPQLQDQALLSLCPPTPSPINVPNDLKWYSYHTKWAFYTLRQEKKCDFAWYQVYFHVFDEELIELVGDSMRESVQRSWGSMQTAVFGEKEGKE